MKLTNEAFALPEYASLFASRSNARRAMVRFHQTEAAWLLQHLAESDLPDLTVRSIQLMRARQKLAEFQ